MRSFREYAEGRWRFVLREIGVEDRLLDGNHHECPACGGKDRFRFDDMDGRGTWFCNSCGAGDGIQLVMRVTGENFSRCARRVEKILSVDCLPEKEFKPKPEVSIIRDRLNALWSGAKDPLVAFNYLRSRGLTQITDLESLRGHSSVPHYQNNIFAGNYPAMLAMITDATGRAVCIHRTYLLGDGKREKKMTQKIDDITGGAIRLKAPVNGRLVVGEGIETTIAGMELRGGGAWALMNAGNMAKWQVPDNVNQLVICADNDASFVGAAAAFELAKRVAGMRREIQVEVIMPASLGKDVLDVRRSATIIDSVRPTDYLMRFGDAPEGRAE